MSFTILEGMLMKQVYEAPKAIKHNFEAKDIITSSMLQLGGANKSGIGSSDDVMKINWSDWGSSST